MNYKFAFPPNLWVGTSSWSSSDWCGVFYPEKIKPEDFITCYAQYFRTVEIDSTWHHMPGANAVRAWRERTPDDFLFAAKVPKTITHEKYLEDCQAEMTRFLQVMGGLGEKLGPLLFQFPYFAKGKDAEEYRSGADFRARLGALLKTLPSDFRFVVEVRNANWIDSPLLDLLRQHRVALCFVDYYTMPALDQILKKWDAVTADFIYVRFIGNHKQIEAKIEKLKADKKKDKDWNELVLDRSREMSHWTPAIASLHARQIPAFVFFNNHYAGFAPGSIRLFAEWWEKQNKAAEMPRRPEA